VVHPPFTSMHDNVTITCESTEWTHICMNVWKSACDECEAVWQVSTAGEGQFQRGQNVAVSGERTELEETFADCMMWCFVPTNIEMVPLGGNREGRCMNKEVRQRCMELTH
jgi:hypothetical protein